MAMEFSTDILVRQAWTDVRLRYNTSSPDTFVSGTTAVVERIWKPDLFFANEKSGYFHEITLPNTMLRLYPNGTILYSARYSLKFSCDMNLEKFPFDTQFCAVIAQNISVHISHVPISLTDKALVFAWKSPEAAITVNSDLKLPKFNLSEVNTLPCSNEHYTGNFSCLKAQFVFCRELGYHFVQSYIPNILLVIASWISFWLDVDAIPARVTLGVTTLLTTTAQGSNIRDVLPPVSYTKAIDVWVGVCTFFVFAALIEFAIVNLMARRDAKMVLTESIDVYQAAINLSLQKDLLHEKMPVTLRSSSPVESRSAHSQLVHRRGLNASLPGDLFLPRKGWDCPDCGEPLVRKDHRPRDSEWSALLERPCLSPELIDKPRAKMVDKVARILFPLSFLLFAIGYAVVYGWIKG